MFGMVRQLLYVYILPCLISGSDGNADIIDPAGFQRFCEDLEVDLEGVLPLVSKLKVGHATYPFMENGRYKNVFYLKKGMDSWDESFRVCRYLMRLTIAWTVWIR